MCFLYKSQQQITLNGPNLDLLFFQYVSKFCLFLNLFSHSAVLKSIFIFRTLTPNVLVLRTCVSTASMVCLVPSSLSVLEESESISNPAMDLPAKSEKFRQNKIQISKYKKKIAICSHCARFENIKKFYLHSSLLQTS